MLLETSELIASPKLISLGDNCQTAHQIRRVTRDNSSYFFDWLITPLNSCNLLALEDANILNSNNWEIGHDGVLDKGTSLIFMHEFKTRTDGSDKVDNALIENQIKYAKAKYLYLKQKTISDIHNSNRCYIIRRESELVYPRDAKAIAENIISNYIKINPMVRLVLVSPVAQSETFSPYYIFVKCKDKEMSADDQNWWQGDDASWERIFGLASSWFRFIGIKD